MILKTILLFYLCFHKIREIELKFLRQISQINYRNSTADSQIIVLIKICESVVVLFTGKSN